MEENDESRHTLHDYWHIIRKKKWMIILFVFTTTLTVTIGNFLMSPVYEASVKLHIKRQTSSVLGGDLIGSGISGLSTKEEINTQIQILKSRSVLEKVITELDLIDKFKMERILNEEERLQSALDKLRKDISINHLTNTRLLSVSIRSTNPELARDIVNFISHAFIDRNVESKRGEATAVLAFVSSQLILVSEKLNSAEEALLKYKQSEGIGVLSDEAKLKVDRLAQLESSYQEIKIERDILATRISAVLKQIEPAGTMHIEGTMGSGNVTPVNSALKMNLTELKYRDIELTTAEDALTDFIKTLEKNIDKLPAQEINLIRLERARRINDELYAALTEAKNEAQLEAASKKGNIDIIDSAVTPFKAVYPKKKENVIIGFVISLLIGLSLAFILEYLDNTVKSEEEVRKILETPILGLIPQYNSDSSRRWSKSKMNPNGFTLEALENPMSSTSEAFRLLGVNVNFADLDKGLKTIVVTSPLPGDGKTTIASNLAIILAAREEKVLIIDTDFRIPAIHKIFQFYNFLGVTNILSKGTDYKLALHKKKGADNLDILTSGPIPPNPSEILGSRRMNDFIEELSADYDRIIFDSPPVFGATDALVLASMLDGVLMVFRAGKIDKKVVKRTKEVFNTANLKILGGILNGIDTKDERFGYGYYNNYYGKEEKRTSAD